MLHWLDQIENFMANRDGPAAFSEIGYVPGDLFTLALDYMDNQGRPADSFTRTWSGGYLRKPKYTRRPMSLPLQNSPALIQNGCRPATRQTGRTT